MERSARGKKVDGITLFMLQTRNGSFIESRLLRGCPGITHGFSTRALGDMRSDTNRQSFLGESDRLLIPEQIHGNIVKTIDNLSISPVISADGLVLNTSDSNNHSVVLGVLVADCVPLLFADKKNNSIAVAHAGWKGTLGNIAANVVKQMVVCGTRREDIIVVIGPHIGMCCYDVPEDRVKLVQSVYGVDEKVAYKAGGLWHMDIGYINLLQLKRAGILGQHIDASPSCTSCQHDLFYSYRKDTKETFGETIGVIGYI